MLTIVMYHYVRDLAGSRYPRIKGRSVETFECQLDYIAANYRVCSQADVVDAVQGKRRLPDRACVLTFDDGIRDHFDEVFPRLKQRGWTGAFFPPAHPIENRRVLDVHKLHFVLAVCKDADKLARRALNLVADHRNSHDIPADNELMARFTSESRFDPPSVIFIKRLLQHGLPPAVRTAVTHELFARIVTRDESSFADELYVSLEQLREMQADGMEIGGHGDRHEWLEHMSSQEQDVEIDRTLAFLDRVYGRRKADWAMCYPYGSYNAQTLQLLRTKSCAIGLTTRVGVNLALSNPLELMRLDTNDLPCPDSLHLLRHPNSKQP
ncbi:MAG: polysaccharide deacetylase family protein [Planctomycetes bacterium]|nr:polysaccharide deacetylase family protein [Planctomycetota bacterium]